MDDTLNLILLEYDILQLLLVPEVNLVEHEIVRPARYHFDTVHRNYFGVVQVVDDNNMLILALYKFDHCVRSDVAEAAGDEDVLPLHHLLESLHCLFPIDYVVNIVHAACEDFVEYQYGMEKAVAGAVEVR